MEVFVRVAMYYRNDDIRIEELEMPEAGRGELVVRVMASGICGSDVMEWYRKGKTPLVLGHEIAGDVVAVGEDVASYALGQRVSASHHVPCHTCRYCLADHHTVCDTLRRTKFYPGGLSEYLRLPAINVDRGVYVLPDEMTYEEATFIEPLACVYRGQRIAGVAQGMSVLVVGSGISGVLHVALARALGVSLVASTDVHPYRLEAGERAGADAAIDASRDVPAEFRRLNSGRGADVVILSAGAPEAIEQAFDAVDRGGTVLFFAPAREDAAVPLPVNRLFWRNEVTLTSSYAANYAEHMAALEFIRSGRVRVQDMVTHTLPLARTQEGFRLVAEAGESMKVIIKPQE
jgi:L-iditol 2-dehydrogenase